MKIFLFYYQEINKKALLDPFQAMPSVMAFLLFNFFGDTINFKQKQRFTVLKRSIKPHSLFFLLLHDIILLFLFSFASLNSSNYSGTFPEALPMLIVLPGTARSTVEQRLRSGQHCGAGNDRIFSIARSFSLPGMQDGALL